MNEQVEIPSSYAHIPFFRRHSDTARHPKPQSAHHHSISLVAQSLASSIRICPPRTTLRALRSHIDAARSVRRQRRASCRSHEVCHPRAMKWCLSEVPVQPPPAALRLRGGAVVDRTLQSPAARPGVHPPHELKAPLARVRGVVSL